MFSKGIDSRIVYFITFYHITTRRLIIDSNKTIIIMRVKIGYYKCNLNKDLCYFFDIVILVTTFLSSETSKSYSNLVL